MKKSILLLMVMACSVYFVNAQWQLTSLSLNANGTITTNGSTVFSASFSYGVYRSDNDGVDWNSKNTGLTTTATHQVAVSGSHLYVGTAGNGVFLSGNNGDNWAPANNGPHLDRRDVFRFSVSGSTVYAATDSGLYYSSNYGSSWVILGGGMPAAYISTVAINGSYVFASSSNNVYRSSDNGTSWTAINNGFISTPYVQAFAFKGAKIFAADASAAIYISTDNGDNWTLAINGCTGGAGEFAMTGTTMYAGNFYQGVFFSTDIGGSWHRINEGLNDSTIYSVSVTSTSIYASSSYGLYKRPLSEVSSVKENYMNGSFTFYPNPVAENLVVHHTNAFSKKAVSFSIINTLGEVVLENSVAQGSDASINTRSLPAGIYFLQIKSENESATERFIKE